MSECESCKNKKDWPCPNTCGYMGTCDGWEPKPMTNADRIRAMSDEELAEWITELADSAVYPYTRKDAPCISIGQTCAASWLDWLKQEAVSNG